jgi:thymidylate synthase
MDGEEQMLPYFEGESLEALWPHLMASFRELKAACEVNHVQASAGRGGLTLEMLHAVLHIHDPRQRWAFSRQPALNPAFALAEVIWMLAGRRDSRFVNYWNPLLPRFAGDGETYHGAYGWRLRHEHGIDQLQRAYETLHANPDSRQVVLQIWKPTLDLPRETGTPAAPDIPCNISSLLKVREGRLDWLQIMRSNDVVRGLPYNVVQWTSLQEIMAGWLGVQLGSYVHLSDSLHVYGEHWQTLDESSGEILQPTSAPHRAPDRNNVGSLALTKEEFDVVFPCIEQRAEALTQDDLTSKELCELCILADVPVAYSNILLVLAADSARRRGWQEVAVDLMQDCTNPSLSYLWNRWLDRKTSETARRSAG